jgi:2'-5' RNA ligase
VSVAGSAKLEFDLSRLTVEDVGMILDERDLGLAVTERREVKDGKITAGVFLPLPQRLAKDFPDKSHEDDSVPHITLLYVGDITPEQQRKLVRSVKSVLAYVRPFTMNLNTYDEFANKHGQTIPNMTGTSDHPHGLGALHVALWRAIENAGVPVAHTYGEYDPGKPDAGSFKVHATLNYLEPGEAYKGPKPTGSWKVNEVEVWGHEKDKAPLGVRLSEDKAEALRDALESTASTKVDGRRHRAMKDEHGNTWFIKRIGAYRELRHLDSKPYLKASPKDTVALAAMSDGDEELFIVRRHKKTGTDKWRLFLETREIHELRDSCLDCVRKHLAQALVLMQEVPQGYPAYRWVAIGHMGEAADECVKEYPKLADEIRKHRLKYMADPYYSVPILKLIEKAGSYLSENSLPGGKGDKLKPSDVDQKELAKGIEIEMEHTRDRAKALEIALDHLAEDPNYYTKLAKVHRESFDLDETVQFFEGRRRRKEKLSPEELETKQNWEADQDYLKWVNGYSDPRNEHAELDENVPSDRTDEAIADLADDSLAEEAYPGGAVSGDRALFEKYKTKLKDWPRGFMENNIERKEKGFSCSPKQAKWYAIFLKELEGYATSDPGYKPPQKKKKKKYTPSAYQAAIFDWVKEAAKKPEAALVVDAKAGAGKSSTMEDALDFIPSNQKVAFLAFNTDIAAALAERVEDKKNVEAATINAFGRASVVKGMSKGGVPPELDKQKNRKICDAIVGALTKDKKVAYAYEGTYSYDMAEAITKRKMMAEVDDEGNMTFPDWDAVLKKFSIDLPTSKKQTKKQITKKQLLDGLEQAFQQSVDDTDTMEFADQILWPVMHDLPVISRASGKKANLDWVMVDEVQDLAPLERAFVKRLAPRNVLVGDPNQSIYAFKGSDPDSMEKLGGALKADEKPLSICYRCPKAVIKEAQRLVPGIEAAPNAAEGEVSTIKHEEFFDKLKPGDFVMCRTNAPNVQAALSLLAMGKKAVVVGRDIGKSLSKLISQIGGKYHANMPIAEFTQKLSAWYDKERKRILAEKKEHLIQGLDDKRDCIDALMEKPGVKVAGDLVSVIKDLFVNDPSPAINFSSVHKAKGLEADHCYIQRPDLMPHPMSTKTEDPIAMQQEENLEYVAITRAKKTLTWVLPPPKEGEEDAPPPTPFKKETPAPEPPAPAPEPEKPKKVAKKKTKKKAKKKVAKKAPAKKKTKADLEKEKADIAKLLDLIPDTSTVADWGSLESESRPGNSLFERVAYDWEGPTNSTLLERVGEQVVGTPEYITVETLRRWADKLRREREDAGLPVGRNRFGEGTDLPHSYGTPAGAGSWRSGVGTAPLPRLGASSEADNIEQNIEQERKSPSSRKMKRRPLKMTRQR